MQINGPLHEVIFKVNIPGASPTAHRQVSAFKSQVHRLPTVSLQVSSFSLQVFRQPPTATVLPQPTQPLNAIAVFEALGSKIRWPILLLLADGKPRTATDVASVLGRDFDGVSKHLRLLRAAGLVDWRVGEDRRLLLFSIPEKYRREPGVLDFGVCTVRLQQP